MALPMDEMPTIVEAQEIACTIEEWRATLNTIDNMGYAVYASKCILDGTKQKGVLTMVKYGRRSKQVDEVPTKDSSSALAVVVEDVLFINSYAPPYDQALFNLCSRI